MSAAGDGGMRVRAVPRHIPARARAQATPSWAMRYSSAILGPLFSNIRTPLPTICDIDDGDGAGRREEATLQRGGGGGEA